MQKGSGARWESRRKKERLFVKKKKKRRIHLRKTTHR